MSKTRFVLMAVLAFGFAIASPTQANEFAGANASSVAATENAEANGAYPYQCYATTYCRNFYGYAYPLACAFTASSCWTWIVPGYSVQCQGYDAWGRWVNIYYRCY